MDKGKDGKKGSMITTKESAEIDRDGTGYTINVKKNHESYAQRLRDMAKDEGGSSGGIRPFVLCRLRDLKIKG